MRSTSFIAGVRVIKWKSRESRNSATLQNNRYDVNVLNATLLLNSSVDLKIVSEHLGHSIVDVTADVYADALKSSKMKAADLISLKLA